MDNYNLNFCHIYQGAKEGMDGERIAQSLGSSCEMVKAMFIYFEELLL